MASDTITISQMKETLEEISYDRGQNQSYILRSSFEAWLKATPRVWHQDLTAEDLMEWQGFAVEFFQKDMAAILENINNFENAVDLKKQLKILQAGKQSSVSSAETEVPAGKNQA